MQKNDVYTVFFDVVRDIYGDGEYGATGTSYLIGVADSRERAEGLVAEDVAANSGELRWHEDFGDKTLFEEGQYPCGYYSIIRVTMNRRDLVPLREAPEMV